MDWGKISLLVLNLLCFSILNFNHLKAKCISISDAEYFENLANLPQEPDPNSPQYHFYEEIRLCLSVHQDTNREFYPYLDRFLEYGRKYRGATFSLNNLRVVFTLEEDLFYAGICFTNGEIEISYQRYEKLDPIERKNTPRS